MKLGIGLYRSMLNTDHFRFAKQAGATHIVAHMVDYFRSPDSLSTGSGDDVWGVSEKGRGYWTQEELADLKRAINAEGLELAAIENFEPAHWHDILLDGPQKQEQMEKLKTTIRNMGAVGIPVMGYYFSLAGVWGRTEGATARGDAKAVGYLEALVPEPTPIPNGTIWNMVYDMDAPPGTHSPVSREEMWERVTYFLQELVPVAEEAGVRLAAHPDDPPLPELRGMGRLIYQPDHFERLMGIVDSPANAIEFCAGTISEMAGGDIYETVERYSRQNKIAYVHLRNVVGKIPNYNEVFIDEGDTDMFRVLSILHQNNFDGVLIPDHTPQMTCDAPWHAGMAYTLGWMRAVVTALNRQ